jgi:mRNA deadenylase 3'-5' endonuclease subunit Ccr4
MWMPSVDTLHALLNGADLCAIGPVWLCREFKATLDYVLYTRDSLAPSGLLELPSDAEVMSKPGDSLPNANWSSDHVCLMSEFQILPHKTS